MLEFCIYCDTEFPLEQLVVIDVALDENNEEVALYSCQTCSPIVWRHVHKQDNQEVNVEAY